MDTLFFDLGCASEDRAYFGSVGHVVLASAVTGAAIGTCQISSNPALCIEMRRFLATSITLLALVVISSVSRAEEFNPEPGAMIVWVGDSITHQCGYTQYLENFLYTRFHDKKLRFANAAIKGDRAGDLLDRFDEAWQSGNRSTLRCF